VIHDQTTRAYLPVVTMGTEAANWAWAIHRAKLDTEKERVPMIVMDAPASQAAVVKSNGGETRPSTEAASRTAPRRSPGRRWASLWCSGFYWPGGVDEGSIKTHPLLRCRKRHIARPG
jgi:hypothetical protein